MNEDGQTAHNSLGHLVDPSVKINHKCTKAVQNKGEKNSLKYHILQLFR